jgi:hypothetical protein
MYFYRTKDDEYESQYRDKVLPCPFCGTPPMIMQSGERGRGLMLHCIADGCVGPSVSYYEHETTLRTWNRRAGR